MAAKQNRFYVVFPHGEDNQAFDTLDSARGWLQKAMDEERKEAHEAQEWPGDYGECGVFELVPVVKVTESAEDPETGAVDYALTFVEPASAARKSRKLAAPQVRLTAHEVAKLSRSDESAVLAVLIELSNAGACSLHREFYYIGKTGAEHPVYLEERPYGDGLLELPFEHGELDEPIEDGSLIGFEIVAEFSDRVEFTGRNDATKGSTWFLKSCRGMQSGQFQYTAWAKAREVYDERCDRYLKGEPQ